jgi:hypothetical protein
MLRLPVAVKPSLSGANSEAARTEAQEGFGKRSVLRLLNRNEPIEAYCVVCDDFWEISTHELARRLTGQPAFEN